ncbi:MAG: segregation/condensation protein A, partial [Patescibacteria group bacterium]|nr:segregation/condensation protein A [Patescibacteria group bacterium]
PLDLLLNLIEKRKLFINDISISKVADDYIAYIKNLNKFPIDESANFILIASTLLLIKSISLLPNIHLTEEEERDIEDLEKRLRLYQRIKELSVGIKKIFGQNIIFHPLLRKTSSVFSPDESINLPNLLNSAREALKNMPKKESLPKAVVKKIISLEEVIGNLTEKIKTGLSVNFRDFARIGKEDKINIIVSFLAMLELVKQGLIEVMQENQFDDIQMHTQEVNIPKYV